MMVIMLRYLLSMSCCVVLSSKPLVVVVATAKTLKKDCFMDLNTTCECFNDKVISNISEIEIICRSTVQQYIFQSWVQAIFISLYVVIFVVGVGGNLVVLYVILGNKHMRTTVNIYLVNLAASDIIMGLCCSFSPAQTFMGGCWIFGEALCKLVRPSIYVSVYMSTFTLTAIAVNRHRAVLFPFSTRSDTMTRTVLTILCMDIVAIIISLPYAVMMELAPDDVGDLVCKATWPTGTMIVETAYWGFINITQFVVPFTIIVICYTGIVKRLRQRARSQPESRTAAQRQEETVRTERVNKMLVYMVVIFGVCWFPNNLIHLVNQLADLFVEWEGYNLIFYSTHVIAMSSTCYIQPLSLWLDEPSFQIRVCEALVIFPKKYIIRL